MLQVKLLLTQHQRSFTEAQTAVSKLKNVESPSVIESTSTSTGTTSYYIIEMVRTSEKDSNMNKYKKVPRGN